MTNFITVRNARKACLIKLATGWEFGVPPGYETACEVLREHLKQEWVRTYLETEPTQSRITIKLAYGAVGWSLVTQDQFGVTYTPKSLPAINDLVREYFQKGRLTCLS